jgi:phage-related tail fiber protein
VAQHDYDIGNQSGSAFRSDLNNALAAIVSINSGLTEPAVMYAYQLYADTGNNLVKQRNGGNSAWITIGTLGATNWGLAALASPTFTGVPLAPTASAGTNTTQIATTAFVVSSYLPLAGGTVTGNIKLNAQSDIRFADADSSNYVALQAPATVATDLTLTLPATDGSSGQALTTNGSGALAFATIGGVPTGAVFYFAASTAPTGFLKANGAAVSRTTYAALFAVIDITYGVGDGSTTFNLPDLRGEFIRGWDDGRGVDASRVFGFPPQGYATAKPQTTTATRLLGDGTTTTIDASTTNPSAIGFTRVSKTTEGVTAGTIDSTGSGQEIDVLQGVTGDAETRPRNVALLACIKY